MKKTQVKSLVIELDGKDVELSMDQARELQAALNELFGQKEKIREIRIPEPYLVPRYPRPIEPWVWPHPRPFWKLGSRTEARLSDSSIKLSMK